LRLHKTLLDLNVTPMSARTTKSRTAMRFCTGDERACLPGSELSELIVEMERLLAAKETPQELRLWPDSAGQHPTYPIRVSSEFQKKYFTAISNP